MSELFRWPGYPRPSRFRDTPYDTDDRAWRAAILEWWQRVDEYEPPSDWSDVTSLRFGDDEIDDEIVIALARTEVLAPIRQLTIPGGLGDAGARAIASATHLTRLEALTLGPACRIGAEAARALMTSNALAGLRSLDLRRGRLGDRTIGALCDEAPAATEPHLRELWLGHNDIGDAGATALAEWAPLSRLERLDLAHNRIGTRGARALARSRRLDLDFLSLDGNPIGLVGAYALGRSRHRTVAWDQHHAYGPARDGAIRWLVGKGAKMRGRSM